MKRIRSVKPEFWTSQTLARCTRDARLVFVGLWNEADDDGRLVDAPKLLAGALFPWDEDIDAAWMNARLAELVAVGVIVRYEIAAQRYIAVPSFREHQHPDKPKPSKLPAPPENRIGTPSSPPATPGADTSPTVPRRVPDASPGDWEEEKEGEEEREEEKERDRERDLTRTPAHANLNVPRPDRTMQRGVAKLVEDEVAPKTPQELLERLRRTKPDFGEATKQLDGVNGRSTPLELLTRLWLEFEKHRGQRPLAQAEERAWGWLREEVRRCALAWSKDPEAKKPAAKAAKPADRRAENDAMVARVYTARCEVAHEKGLPKPPMPSESTFAAWMKQNPDVIEEAAKRLRGGA